MSDVVVKFSPELMKYLKRSVAISGSIGDEGRQRIGEAAKGNKHALGRTHKETFQKEIEGV